MIAASRRRRIVSNRMVLRVAKLRRAGLVARNCGLAPEAPGGVHAGRNGVHFVPTHGKKKILGLVHRRLLSHFSRTHSNWPVGHRSD